jgi:predicted AlkP superfamily pyrophosphatase or phosphodiesterase
MRSKRCSELFRPVIKSIGSSRLYDLYLVHVGELDGLGHRYGPHPELFQDSLREIDAWVHGTFDSATKRKLALNLIIVSDHGMFDVKDTVDIERKLELIPLKVPEDYLYFLDSTIARFWFFNAKAKRLVEEILSTVPNGHILSQQEKEKLKIDFKLNNFYGELLFWVDKGYMIFPNFFQSITQDKTSGMHGYIDDEDGALIIHSSAGILRDVSNMYGKDVVPLSKVFEITRTVGGF